MTPYVHNLLRTVNFSQVDIRDWAIIDLRATSNFLVTEALVVDIVPAVNPLTVTIPNGYRVQSTHDCKIAIPDLPEKARIGHIVPGLASHSLVSVIKLCNAGCKVTCTKIKCMVKYRGRVVHTGSKCRRTGLWMIPLTPNSMQTTNSTDHTA